MQTKMYGSENSWSLGSCVSSRAYKSDKKFSQVCCMPSGNYDLTCKDSGKDGWNGGHITIKSTRYCKEFGHWSERNEVVPVPTGRRYSKKMRDFKWLWEIIFVNIILHVHLIGVCYCEHASGETDKNKIICINDATHKLLDLCNSDEGCIGPTAPNNARFFSRSIFCSKGELECSYRRTF